MNSRSFCLIIILMLLCLDVSYAAFPVKQQNQRALVIEKNSITLPDLKTTTVQPAPVNGDNTAKNTAIGASIMALVCGAAGLFIFGVPFGIAAIVFGIIGVKKSLKGLAIAGIVLGIID